MFFIFYPDSKIGEKNKNRLLTQKIAKNSNKIYDNLFNRIKLNL